MCIPVFSKKTVAILISVIALITVPLAQADASQPAGSAAAHYKQLCASPTHKKATCDLRTLTDATGRLLTTAAFHGLGLTPLQLRNAYSLPYNAGKGQTVNIILAEDDPNAESDLAAYRAQFGLPACTTANGCLKKVNKYYESSPLPPAGTFTEGVETALDMEAVSATCPYCNITLVEADPDQTDLGAFFDANYDAITTGGAKYISNSWGFCEDPGEYNADPAFLDPGGAVTAATGDFGYASPCGSPGPLYPAASPNTVAVGETLLTPNSSKRGWAESASSSTGSGCSLYEPAPAWQRAQSLASGCNGNRVTNDLAVAGDPAGGALAVYDTYLASDPGWHVVGGTSQSAPIAAAMFAMAGPPASQGAASRLYGRPWAVNDITAGSNGTCTPALQCTAGPGWDGPSGVGSPMSLALFNP